jgi:hypothetical protein
MFESICPIKLVCHQCTNRTRKRENDNSIELPLLLSEEEEENRFHSLFLLLSYHVNVLMHMFKPDRKKMGSSDGSIVFSYTHARV